MVTTAYGNGAQRYWIIEPTQGINKTLPVVFFVHGFNATHPRTYDAWIRHLVRRGNVVIYPQYQAGNLVDPTTFTDEAAKALRQALQKMDGKRHAKVDRQQLTMIGHSLGGTIIANLAARPRHFGIPTPGALMPLQSGDTRADTGLGSLLPSITEDHSTIPAGTLMLIVDVANDYFVSPKAGQRLYDNAKQVHTNDKRRLLLYTDDHGEPAIVADHSLPTGWSLGQGGFTRVNTYDIALWQWFDALQAAAEGDEVSREEGSGKTMKIGLAQMDSGADVQANLAQAERLVREAAGQGADLVALPEVMHLRVGGSLAGRYKEVAEPIPGPTTHRFAALAKELGVQVLLGSIGEESDDSHRTYNTAVLLGRDGTVSATYRKVHLFDVSVDEQNGDRESGRYLPGSELVVTDLESAQSACKAGLSICYDLRFGELFRSLALRGAGVVFVPANFTMATGQMHWMTLLRARAIENGLFIIAPAQCGRFEQGFEAFGHSTIVDPWGRVLVEHEGEPGVSVTDIDLSEVESARRAIPEPPMKRRQATEPSVSHIDPIADEEWVDDKAQVREEISATLTTLMPWGISILAHVALIVLAFFLVWQTIVEDQAKPHRASNSTSNELTALTSDIPEPSEQEASSGASALAVQITPVEPVDLTMIGSTFAPPQIVPGISRGDFDGVIPGPRTGDEPPTFFGGLGADRIVFLIDASGSMVDVLPFVISELKQAVHKLQPRQTEQGPVPRQISVILFSGKGVHEVPGGGGVKGLREATPKFKSDILEWVSLENFNFDTGGRGSAHVKPALIRALGYKPELIILLSDNLTGGGQGATQHELIQDDLLNLIHQHNKAKPPARINTIQFLYEDPLVRQGLQGTLDRIAEETGGTPRFIGQEDLDLR
eukprot:g12437.t1